MPNRRSQKERLYSNAPLVEVFADIRWNLQPLTSMPGAFIDPFYDIFQNRFAQTAASKGFIVVEPRISEGIPIELMGHKAFRLFRTAPGKWPVYQIGPGVFTANIVPPYAGWTEFTPYVEEGLSWLAESYPGLDYLTIQSVSLRYVNAFTEQHGMRSEQDFINEYLGFKLKLPKQIIASSQGGAAAVRPVGEIRLPLKKPIGANGHIVWKEGTANAQPAVLLDFVVSSQNPKINNIATDVISILQEAHEEISRWFEAIITNKIRPFLGDETEI